MKSTYTHFVCVWTNERDERSEREPDDDIGSCCGSKVCKHAANIKAINPQLEDQIDKELRSSVNKGSIYFRA